MLIANSQTQKQWQIDGIVKTVATWFGAQTSTQSVAACATATNLTYAQVAWALVTAATLTNYPMVVLPESDSELADATVIMRAWQ